MAETTKSRKTGAKGARAKKQVQETATVMPVPTEEKAEVEVEQPVEVITQEEFEGIRKAAAEVPELLAVPEGAEEESAEVVTTTPKKAEKVRKRATAEMPEEVAPPEASADTGSLVQQLINTRHFRKRVIARVVKKLR